MQEIIKVSIITVCYNAEDTIGKTIDSILNQTYPHVEFIIIDGASTDNTIDLIKSYEERISNRGYEFIFSSEKDSGIYDAMNKGILLSSGEWVHFKNSGDYFFSSDVLTTIFSSEIKSDTEILHGDVRFWDQYGYCDLKPRILSKSYREAMPVWHPSTFIKSKLHKELLFDASYRLSGDYKFFYQCCETGVSFQYLPFVVTLFDVGQGATVQNRMVSIRENLRLKGLDKNLQALFVLYTLECYNIIRNYTLGFMPVGYIKKRRIISRRKKGWVITI